MKNVVILLSTGIRTIHKENKKAFKVKSEKLKQNPLLNLTIEQYNNIKTKKIGRVVVPKKRKSINEFFEMFTPHNEIFETSN